MADGEWVRSKAGDEEHRIFYHRRRRFLIDAEIRDRTWCACFTRFALISRKAY